MAYSGTTMHSDIRMLMSGTPWKRVLAFSAPVFAAYLAQVMYGAADAVMTGRILGQSSLSAVGNAVTLTTAFGCLSWGFSAGTNSVLSRYGGSGDEDAFRDCSETAVAMSLAIGFATMALCITSCGFVYRYVMDVPDAILDMTLEYTFVFSAGFTFQFGYNAVASVMRSAGDTVTVMCILVGGAVLNTALDLLFLLPAGMGVGGVAAATVMCQILSFAVICIMFGRKYPDLRPCVGTKMDRRYAGEILSAGLPLAVQQAAVFGSALLFQQAANGFGEAMAASYAAERRLESFCRLPASAVGAGMLTFAGLCIGAGERRRLSEGVRQILAMSVVITCCVSASSFVFAEQLASLFGLEGEALYYCTGHIRAVSAMFPMFALYFPMLALFQAAKRPGLSLAVVILEIAVRLAALCILADPGLLGYSAVWWNVLFGWSACTAVCAAYLLKGGWMKTVSSAPEGAGS